jgi:hypothetical protein
MSHDQDERERHDPSSMRAHESLLLLSDEAKMAQVTYNRHCKLTFAMLFVHNNGFRYKTFLLMAGIVLSFARAFGEFGATLMLAGNVPGKTQTMFLPIYEAVVSGEDQVAEWLALILTVISVTVVYFTNRLSRFYLMAALISLRSPAASAVISREKTKL